MKILAALTGGLVVAVLWGEARSDRKAVRIFKPLASAGFVACAVAAGAANSVYGHWILAALVWCWLGDVLLVSRRPRAFRAGLASFLIGHLAFSVALLVRGVDPTWTAAAGAFLLGAALLVARWLLPSVQAGLRGPVVAYILVISVMVALGVGAWAHSGRELLVAAPVAFYLSDLAVARDRFIAANFINRLWGLPLYYGAQLLFAFSVA